jgi:DNA-directed RNA polymerase specialized sigma24 family protein
MQLRTWEEVPESRLIYSPSGREALRMDVRIVVASLPAQLQRLCLALMKFGVSEAARRLGISIGVTKYRIKLIREQFSEAGVTL